MNKINNKIAILFFIILATACVSSLYYYKTNDQQTMEAKKQDNDHEKEDGATDNALRLDCISKDTLIEPSGIIYHPKFQSFFVVSDEGYIYEIAKNGRVKRKKMLKKADFEGIAMIPASGLLYIVVEKKEVILEIDPIDLTILRTFFINRSYENKLVLNEERNGVEGITFVPDKNKPMGGSFFMVNQGSSKKSIDDAPALFEVILPITAADAKEQKVDIVWYRKMDVLDLADIFYSDIDDVLYVVSDKNNLLLLLSKKGELIKTFDLPGENQEGICQDENGALYITQDTGEIFKIGNWQSQQENE